MSESRPSESKAKWDDVGDRFTALGRKLKTHYDTNAHAKPEAEPEPEKVHDAQFQGALRQISDALDAGFTALGESLRDPEMRDDLKSAGNAIGDALTASLEDVKNAIKR